MARSFGVCPRCVATLCSGRAWKQAPPPHPPPSRSDRPPWPWPWPCPCVSAGAGSRYHPPRLRPLPGVPPPRFFVLIAIVPWATACLYRFVFDFLLSDYSAQKNIIETTKQFLNSANRLCGFKMLWGTGKTYYGVNTINKWRIEKKYRLIMCNILYKT